MLRKILDRGHPLGLVGSMWATAGAEQASREIKKARSFARNPPSPLPRRHPTEPTRGPLPFFLITVRRKGGKEHNTAVTNGLKTSWTRKPFHNHALTPAIEDST